MVVGCRGWVFDCIDAGSRMLGVECWVLGFGYWVMGDDLRGLVRRVLTRWSLGTGHRALIFGHWTMGIG